MTTAPALGEVDFIRVLSKGLENGGPLRALAVRLMAPLVEVGDLSLDRSRHAVTVAGVLVDLAPFEVAVLWVLASSPGIVFERDEIFALSKALRGEITREYTIEDRTIDVHVAHIRRAIGKEWIRTVRGVGYVLEAPPPDKPGPTAPVDGQGAYLSGECPVESCLVEPWSQAFLVVCEVPGCGAEGCDDCIVDDGDGFKCDDCRSAEARASS